MLVEISRRYCDHAGLVTPEGVSPWLVPRGKTRAGRSLAKRLRATCACQVALPLSSQWNHERWKMEEKANRISFAFRGERTPLQIDNYRSRNRQSPPAITFMARLHACSVAPRGSIILPQDSHDGLWRPPRVITQTHRIGVIHLVRNHIRPLQLLEQLRHVAPVRTFAVVLIGRHPIVVRLPPLLRNLCLFSRVDAVLVGLLGCFLCRVASALEFHESKEAVIVFVAEVGDAATVTTALCDKARSASRLRGEGALAFVETNTYGIVVLIGLRETALDLALPIRVVVFDRKPELHVVVDTHVEVRVGSRYLVPGSSAFVDCDGVWRM